MSEQRVINLDPSFLKISENKTRKKKSKSKDSDAQIKIKSSKIKQPKVSTIKRNLLKIIRQNQEKRLKKEKQAKMSSLTNTTMDTYRNMPTSDFDQSVNFLSSVSKSQPQTKHKTFRNYEQPKEKQEFIINPDVNTNIQEVTNIVNNTDYQLLPEPQYGILKNGLKPTYRNWKNQTQKNNISPKLELHSSLSEQNYEKELKNKIRTYSEREQREQINNENKKNKQSQKQKKRRKTIRRTYRIGKSKVHPRISILVSSKTIRNNANLHRQQLRETSIHDIKKYLRKYGFIRVGTNSPNDVLRQMYENVRMINGEVHNRNPDNLLFNYLNDLEKSNF